MRKTDMKDPAQQAVSEIARDCIAVRIRLLSRTISNIYDQAFRPLGATVGQMNILVVVARLGPMAPGDAARRLSMEKSTLSRNVERMRANGWVNVEQGDTGRTQVLSISAKGRRLLVKALPLWQDAQTRTESLLGQQGTKSIHRAADAVWAGLEGK